MLPDRKKGKGNAYSRRVDDGTPTRPMAVDKWAGGVSGLFGFWTLVVTCAHRRKTTSS